MEKIFDDAFDAVYEWFHGKVKNTVTKLYTSTKSVLTKAYVSAKKALAVGWKYVTNYEFVYNYDKGILEAKAYVTTVKVIAVES